MEGEARPCVGETAGYCNSIMDAIKQAGYVP